MATQSNRPDKASPPKLGRRFGSGLNRLTQSAKLRKASVTVMVVSFIQFNYQLVNILIASIAGLLGMANLHYQASRSVSRGTLNFGSRRLGNH